VEAKMNLSGGAYAPPPLSPLLCEVSRLSKFGLHTSILAFRLARINTPFNLSQPAWLVTPIFEGN